MEQDRDADKADEGEGPQQGALFRIEGPDEDGCVWICSAEGREVWCQNLGPEGPTAAVMADWLAANDFGEKMR